MPIVKNGVIGWLIDCVKTVCSKSDSSRKLLKLWLPYYHHSRIIYMDIPEKRMYSSKELKQISTSIPYMKVDNGKMKRRCSHMGI